MSRLSVPLLPAAERSGLPSIPVPYFQKALIINPRQDDRAPNPNQNAKPFVPLFNFAPAAPDQPQSRWTALSNFVLGLSQIAAMAFSPQFRSWFNYNRNYNPNYNYNPMNGLTGGCFDRQGGGFANRFNAPSSEQE